MSQKRSFPKRKLTLTINPPRLIRRGSAILSDEYDIGEHLGTGSYGDVYECCHLRTGHKRAVKVIPKSADEIENVNIMNEFKILRDLDHPNILKIYELLEDEDSFYIVSDVYHGGELFHRIVETGSLREDHASTLMVKLLSAVNYCHNRNVVHKDLKPENILLDNPSKLDDLKIIDFGISQVSSSSNNHAFCEPVVGSPGSICYMAPEVFGGVVGSKSDVWACGVIAFVILGGYAPFQGNEEQMMEQITLGQVTFDYSVWDVVTDEAKEFILYLLNPNVESRPTAEEALNHPWLQHERQRDSVKSQSDSFLFEAARSSLENLQEFHAETKLKQATCAIIACQLLTKEDRRRIDDVFRALDRNCNGLLERNELLEGFRTYYGTSLNPKELDAIFSRVDMAGNGCIDYSEFVVASIIKQKLLDADTLRNAFEMFDKDKNGFIDFHEIKRTLGLGENWDDYVVDKIIKEVDEDQDGKISFEDFKEAMSLSRQSSAATTLSTTGRPTVRSSSHLPFATRILLSQQ